jgi:hypothetical protein
LTFGLGSGEVRRYSLGGAIVDPRFSPLSGGCLRWQVVVFRVFLVYLDLLCKGVPPSPCISSIDMDLFIKRDESLFGEVLEGKIKDDNVDPVYKENRV